MNNKLLLTDFILTFCYISSISFEVSSFFIYIIIDYYYNIIKVKNDDTSCFKTNATNITESEDEVSQ